ncbi:hypothetical protein BDY19DRAFT_952489 [Irpex rosettiformis]|uniref:Uncharacterized protein n=1 Tax=Irpex rosettiformis TaxID=378272 RepID=A0ACB8U1K2_9APHY|nr:hypothetical protein BDY19DRAFT_952489 [Irpex rosettiformis]
MCSSCPSIVPQLSFLSMHRGARAPDSVSVVFAIRRVRLSALHCPRRRPRPMKKRSRSIGSFFVSCACRRYVHKGKKRRDCPLSEPHSERARRKRQSHLDAGERTASTSPSLRRSHRPGTSASCTGHASLSESLPSSCPRPSISTPPSPGPSSPSAASFSSRFFFILSMTLSARLKIPPVGAPHAAHFGVFANRLMAHAESK